MGILLLEDETTGQGIVRVLSRKGFDAQHVRRGSDAIHEVQRNSARWKALVLDLELLTVAGLPPDEFMGRPRAGLLVLDRLRQGGFDGLAVVLSARDGWCTPADCERLMITKVISKRVDYSAQILAVELLRILFPKEWQQRAKLLEDVVLDELPDLRSVLQQVREYAYRDTHTLLLGEPGVGKEAICRYYFVHSGRNGQFVQVPGAIIAGDGMRVALCGQEQGFPQPSSPLRPGAFEMAGYGVVYIGELGQYVENTGADLGPLFSATDERYVTRAGGTKPVAVHCAIVASANDLSMIGEAIRTRFEVVHVPPLRQRARDIEILAKHLRARYLEDWAVFNPRWEITEDRLQELRQDPLLGNVRTIERWVRTPNGRLAEIGDHRSTPEPLRQTPRDTLTITICLKGGRADYRDLLGQDGEVKRLYWEWLVKDLRLSRKELREATGLKEAQIDAALQRFSLSPVN